MTSATSTSSRRSTASPLRPLQVAVRPPLRLRYAVLLHAPACWFVRTCAEVNFELFGNFDGLLQAVWVSVCRKNMGEAHPPPRQEEQRGLPAAMVHHLIWLIWYCVILALLLTLPSVFGQGLLQPIYAAAHDDGAWYQSRISQTRYATNLQFFEF